MKKNEKEVQLATIKLFHSVKNITEGKKVHFSKLVKCGIIPVTKSGIIVEKINAELASLIIDNLGIKSTEWTQSFHKNWEKVATAPIERLIAEQVLNYFSNYGMELFGLETFNYIPVEKILVDVEATPSKESFIVVKILTDEELKTEIVNLVQTVSSPHRDLVVHIKTLLNIINDIDVDSIKSFEIKTMYCDMHNKVPSESQDFLRLAIYKSSGLTTIVKDKRTIENLKMFSKTKYAETMFEKADLKKLSESFYRLKPLFLAFKTNKKLASTINKIRRYANTNHKPLNGFVLSNLMKLLSQERKDDAIKVIEKANVRELVKLINFTQYEINAKDHIYNIRNGKVFVKIETERKKTNINRVNNLVWLWNFCKDRIILLLDNVYSGFTFYIPEGIEYVVPISEKQMSDILPIGTRITLPKNAQAICIGGHWFNQNERVDLDFHLNSSNGSFGWNSSYRTSKKDVLFSGDMTDAPKPFGAVEAFRISSSVKDPYLLSVNVYNTEGEIPFELLFTKDITSECDFESYSESMISAVINPENAIAPKLNLKTHKKEEIIGYYYNKSFILYNSQLGGGRRTPKRELMQNILDASFSRCNALMTVKEFIELAGGKVVKTIPNKVEQYIDLSVNNLTATTLFDIVNLKKDRFVQKCSE